MSWSVEMAQLFKARDNPGMSLFHVGIVESVSPLVISIMGGEVMLDGSNTRRVDGNYIKGDKVITPVDFSVGDTVAVIAWQKFILLGKVVDI